MPPRLISILNFKGGVGKSTLAVNLGHALALGGKMVLLVDCDMQANTSTGTLLAAPTTPTLTNVLKGEATFDAAIKPARENLFVVPADSQLDTAATYIASKRQAYYTLRNAMRKLDSYDFVFFDHSPSYSPVTETALLASDEILIPCELVPYAVQGLFLIFDKLKDTLTDHELKNSGIVPINVDMRYSMSAIYLEEIKKEFGDLITPMVRTDTNVPRAQSVQQTVFEYDPNSRAAKDFHALAQFIIGESNGKH